MWNPPGSLTNPGWESPLDLPSSQNGFLLRGFFPASRTLAQSVGLQLLKRFLSWRSYEANGDVCVCVGTICCFFKIYGMICGVHGTYIFIYAVVFLYNMCIVLYNICDMHVYVYIFMSL